LAVAAPAAWMVSVGTPPSTCINATTSGRRASRLMTWPLGPPSVAVTVSW